MQNKECITERCSAETQPKECFYQLETREGIKKR